MLFELLGVEPPPNAKSPAACGLTEADTVRSCCLPVVSDAVPVNVTVNVAPVVNARFEQSNERAVLFIVQAPVELLADAKLTLASPKLPVIWAVEMSSGQHYAR